MCVHSKEGGILSTLKISKDNHMKPDKPVDHFQSKCKISAAKIQPEYIVLNICFYFSYLQMSTKVGDWNDYCNLLWFSW